MGRSGPNPQDCPRAGPAPYRGADGRQARERIRADGSRLRVIFRRGITPGVAQPATHGGLRARGDQDDRRGRRRQPPHPRRLVATVLFGIAILHTFSVKRFETMAHKHPIGIHRRKLAARAGGGRGRVRPVGGCFIGVLGFLHGKEFVVGYLEGRNASYTLNFTEPAFVFAIMAIAATRPVIRLATSTIATAARVIPLPETLSFFAVALVLGLPAASSPSRRR